VTTVIADELDRTREIAEIARVVGGASAGVVLSRTGEVLPLPGLPGDRLVAPGSPVLAVAAEEVAGAGSSARVLVPAPDAGGGQLLRVTALDVARPDLDHLSAAVLMGPPGGLRGLGVLELRVAGLLVEGVTAIPALARGLRVDRATAAGALQQVLVALGAHDATSAAVRALRAGLRIPSRLTTPG
jgi:hypothetical protein